MALMKEPYGLIYNTDGSLCTTVRPDQIPFPGVNSFAVETATENLIQNPDFKDGTQNFSYNSWGGGGYIEAIDGIMHMHNENTSESLALRQQISGLDTSKVYTFSAKVRSMLGNSTSVDCYLGVGYRNLGTAPANGEWVILQYTYQPGEFSSNPVMHFRIGSNKYLQIDWIQLEQKPFASSFVVGSRPKGRLVIPVEDLKFDIANDDWVISYWKYPVATHTNTQNGHNLCSLGQLTSDNSLGYIYWGKAASVNKYNLTVVLNDATSIGNISDNTFNPTDYFRNWHYEVMKKQGKVLSYYVDGVKQCELIIPADKELQTPFDVGLGIGTASGTTPNNALIAAPYCGYNSATWTDEYIREVYEAKIPFTGQNKLSIY